MAEESTFEWFWTRDALKISPSGGCRKCGCGTYSRKTWGAALGCGVYLPHGTFTAQCERFALIDYSRVKCRHVNKERERLRQMWKEGKMSSCSHSGYAQVENTRPSPLRSCAMISFGPLKFNEETTLFNAERTHLLSLSLSTFDAWTLWRHHFKQVVQTAWTKHTVLSLTFTCWPDAVSFCWVKNYNSQPFPCEGSLPLLAESKWRKRVCTIKEIEDILLVAPLDFSVMSSRDKSVPGEDCQVCKIYQD